MKKVIFIALLALATVFAFTACSGTSDGDVTDTTQSLSDLTSTAPDTSVADTTSLTSDESRTDSSLSSDITSMRDENLSEALSGAMTDVSEDVSDMMQ